MAGVMNENVHAYYEEDGGTISSKNQRKPCLDASKCLFLLYYTFVSFLFKIRQKIIIIETGYAVYITYNSPFSDEALLIILPETPALKL